MERAIEVDGLVKRYGDTVAVDGVSFSVGSGEVFGLLGPNGAGKSTTVEILEGHREPTDGVVRVLGIDPSRGGRALRERIGIVLQSAGLDRELTPREVLRTSALAYPRRRDVDEVIDLVGLRQKADARIGTLSGGQQRRVDLALALVGEPELIFLDEPTTGFDPQARREAWTLVERLRELGTTILLTTHYLDEAQHLADRVAVLAGGRIVASGTPDEIGADGERPTRITFRLPSAAVELPDEWAARAEVSGRLVSIAVEDPTEALHELTGWALDHGHELADLGVSRPSLEDVYLRIVGEQGDVASGGSA